MSHVVAVSSSEHSSNSITPELNELDTQQGVVNGPRTRSLQIHSLAL